MVPNSRTSFSHEAWTRELLDLGTIKKIYWCDTRIRTNDGHTEGSIDHDPLYKAVNGILSHRHETKNCKLVKRKDLSHNDALTTTTTQL